MSKIRVASTCKNCSHAVFTGLNGCKGRSRGLCFLHSEPLELPPRPVVIEGRHFYISSLSYRFGNFHPQPQYLPKVSSFPSTKHLSPKGKKELEKWAGSFWESVHKIHFGLKDGSVRVCNAGATCDSHHYKKEKLVASLRKCIEGTDKWGDAKKAEKIVEAAAKESQK